MRKRSGKDSPNKDQSRHEDHTAYKELNPPRELASIVLILGMVLEGVTLEVAHEELGPEHRVNDESQ